MTVAERTPIVEMQDINVAFGGVHAVREVTIDLYAGEVIGLVGGNGAGKSTLMRVLSGAHPADCFREAVAAGAAALLNPGTELCRPHDVKRLAAEVTIEEA